MFCQKCGIRVNTNLIQNVIKYMLNEMKCEKHIQCCKKHLKCDKIKPNATKYMFRQKCGRRVKTKFPRNVIKCDKIVQNVTKCMFCQKCGIRVKVNVASKVQNVSTFCQRYWQLVCKVHRKEVPGENATGRSDKNARQICRRYHRNFESIIGAVAFFINVLEPSTDNK